MISSFLSFKSNADIIYTIGKNSEKLYFYTQTLLSTVAELRIVKDESDSDEDESDAWQQLVKSTNLTDAYTKCML